MCASAWTARRTPTSRIVVDLTQACRHELVAGSDNSLVLKLHTKSAAAKATAPNSGQAGDSARGRRG